MKKLLLVDGNSVLFRAYYSTIYTNPMTTSAGVPTNAVYGFIMLLNKAVSMLQPDALLVAWDAGKKTFRHEKMESYKGTRKPLDDALITQMPIIREYLDDSKIARYEQEGYEADDIIGSMAAAAPDMEISILTSDKDLLQLVNDHTTVLLMKKGLQEFDRMDPAAINEKYGLKPAQIIDLKGLMGDPSDNIPGVAHIGEKTALTLLHSYGSIDGVYEHLSEMKGKRKEYLEEGKESAYLSKEIATIFTQMKLPFDMSDLSLQPDLENQIPFYHKYEMKSLLSRVQASVKKVKTDLQVLDSFTLDPEAAWMIMPLADFSLPVRKMPLYGFFLSQEQNPDQVYYLSAENAKNSPAFLKLLQENSKLTTWDQKVLLHLLKNHDFPAENSFDDVHLGVFLLHSAANSTEDQVEAAGIDLPSSLKDLSKKSAGGFTEERAQDVYASWCAQLPGVWKRIQSEMQAESLEHLYADVELPLSRVLFDMECRGISVDRAVLESIGEEYQKTLAQLEQQIYEYAGHAFKIGSPKQLAEVLFDEMKLSGGGRKRSTAADVLEKMKDSHPIVADILEYRKYSKIISTYIEGLEKYIEDGKIYTTFKQTATQTGRLSSADPNLQNISIKSDEGKAIRKAFYAPDGSCLISADYSQVELRMLAHMADEQFMIQAFQDGIDIHNRTASIIFGVEPDQVTEAQRRTAKTVNFAIIYGQTEFGLSQELKISRLQARDFIQAYFASYPNIHRYMDGLIEFCEENGYVETLLHRRRAIPEIKDNNFMTREFGKRAAMNAPIQGSAADLIKLAMIDMNKAIQERGLKSQMLLQIHDELIFLVPDEEKELMEKLIPEVMDGAMKLSVPLQASVSSGLNWYEAK